jgi:hypothetical protein
MKIENFRTQQFKNLVNYVMTSRGHKGVIKYNFNNRGETKPIRINGINYDDCVAFYRVETQIDNRTLSTPYAICYSDVEKIERKIKLEKVEGKEINIPSSRKVKPQKDAEFDIEVGKLYGLGYNTLIKIVSKTAKEAKYIVLNFSFPNEIIDGINNAMERQYGYYERIDINKLTSWGPTHKEGSIYLNKDGKWMEKGGNKYSYNRVTNNYVIAHVHDPL